VLVHRRGVVAPAGGGEILAFDLVAFHDHPRIRHPGAVILVN